jgi:hypothetical protein
MHVLVVNHYFNPLEPPEHNHVTFYTPDDIFDGPVGRINRLIFAKYSKVDTKRPPIIAPQDYLRWALKPGFTRHLLEQVAETIVYCDCDLYFYKDPIEILDYASDKSITISPHWRTIHSISTDELQFNFRHGLYNGGFFVVTQAGNEILEWWAERCCVECSASSDTTYVDQKYLDLVPLYFDNVGIIKHKGCNVAAWNLNYLRRTIEDNKVLIEGEEIIFIHFSPITIKWIESGLDIHLTEHLAEYNDTLTKWRMEFYRQNKQRFMSQKVASENEII